LKGENYAVTAARRRQMGDVVILDPFTLRERESSAFNPPFPHRPRLLSAAEQTRCYPVKKRGSQPSEVVRLPRHHPPPEWVDRGPAGPRRPSWPAPSMMSQRLYCCLRCRGIGRNLLQV
jgi:hypothetical protein